jgi:hypothetical protein
VKFINDLYPHAATAEGKLQSEADWTVLRTLVRSRASIGTNATILPNLSIGRSAMIGAAGLGRGRYTRLCHRRRRASSAMCAKGKIRDDVEPGFSFVS